MGTAQILLIHLYESSGKMLFSVICISDMYLRWRRMLLSYGAGSICIQVFVFQILSILDICICICDGGGCCIGWCRVYLYSSICVSDILYFGIFVFVFEMEADVVIRWCRVYLCSSICISDICIWDGCGCCYLVVQGPGGKSLGRETFTLRQSA